MKLSRNPVVEEEESQMQLEQREGKKQFGRSSDWMDSSLLHPKVRGTWSVRIRRLEARFFCCLQLQASKQAVAGAGRVHQQWNRSMSEMR